MFPTTDDLFRRFYPDKRWDGTKAFYGWLRQHAGPDSIVLNLGAGPATRNPVRVLRGEVRRVAGADVDPIVLENDEIDDGHLIDGDRLPFDEETFDLVFADFVLEHVERPRPFLSEVQRVMKPGARFFFRTPNIAHYVAIVSWATPQWFHRAVANRARRMESTAHEPWPTHYRLNFPATLKREARRAGFKDVELRMVEAEPSYLVFHQVPFLVGVAYERMVNRFERLAPFRACIFGCLTK
ncbi:MAG: methyltransferase domain-containing protein [Polyangiaceae bacterium]|nr:methyltransferase domain-containing protein [Polyangiaceae bacterium]